MKDLAKNKKITDFIPDFEKRIEEVPVNDIEFNEFNPRKKFGQEEEDDLIESIHSRGVLVPIIVYQTSKNGKKSYVLLDGQRRVQACRKLGLQKIQAHVIAKEPSFIENLSLMFHIHNVHEDWTDVAIVNSIEKIIKALGMDRNNLTKEDIKILKKWTSLSDYKIKKYRDLLHYPDSILNRFQEAETKEDPDLDLDLLSELRTPIKKIQKMLPELARSYPEEKIVDIFISKKKQKVLSSNKEIRALSKIMTNAKKKNIRIELVKEKIQEFFDNPECSISDIYSDTAEPIEQAKSIVKTVNKLKSEIDNIDLRKLTQEEKHKLKIEIDQLIESMKRKMSD